MIKCPKCNKENQDHYEFCLGCGKQLKGKKMEDNNHTITYSDNSNNLQNSFKYEYFLTVGKIAIFSAIIVLVFMGYNLVLVQTPLFENISFSSASKTKAFYFFILYLIIMSIGVICQAVYFKKTTNASVAQIWLSTIFPFIMSFVPIAGLAWTGYFAYQHLKYQRLAGYTVSYGMNSQISMATGNYKVVGSVKTGRASFIIGYLLLLSMFLQVVVLTDGFAGNSIANKFEISRTSSYLQWDGKENFSAKYGKYIISDKIIDGARIDIKGHSEVIVKGCTFKNCDFFYIGDDATINIEDSSIIDSHISLWKSSTSFFNHLQVVNCKFNCRDSSKSIFGNVTLKNSELKYTNKSIARFNVLKMYYSLLNINDNSKVSAKTLIASNILHNQKKPSVVYDILQFRGKSVGEFDNLKIDSDKENALAMTDESRVKAVNVDIFAYNDNAVNISGSNLLEISGGSIQSGGRGTISARSYATILLNNVQVKNLSEEKDNYSLYGKGNSVFVVKGGSVKDVSLGEDSVLAYYGEEITGKTEINLYHSSYRARIVKVGSKDLSMADAAKEYKNKK